MSRTIVLFFALILFPSLALAAQAGPTQTFSEDQILRGTFIQTHQRRLPKKPIRSEGRFTIAPHFGVLFAYDKPVPLTLVITPLGMAQVIAGVSFTLGNNPNDVFLPRVPELLYAALSGKWKKLDPYFSVTHDKSPTGWRVLMIPKSYDTGGALFKELSASGNAHVEQAEIRRIDNLYDFFIFNNHAIGDDKLTKDELANFKKAVPDNVKR